MTERATSWIPLFIGLVLVLGAAVVFTWLMRPEPEAGLGAPAATHVVARDAFERSVASGLGRTSVGHPWIEWSGRWAVDAGVAHVVEPSPSISFAVLDLGGVASISAKVGGNSTCGIIAAATSPTDLVELVRLPGRRAWRVRVVTGTQEVDLGDLAPPDGPTVDLSLRVEGDVVTATAGSETASFVLDREPTGTNAGLLASGTAPKLCTFDDVAGFVPKE